jgi:hypothetical protein
MYPAIAAVSRGMRRDVTSGKSRPASRPASGKGKVFKGQCRRWLDSNQGTKERCNNLSQMGYEHWIVSTETINSCDWEDPPSQTLSNLFVGHFAIVFSYVVDGNRHFGKFHSSHEWNKDTEVGLLYNPSKSH